MPDAVLLLIESNTTGTGKFFVREAQALGLKPILLTSNSDLYPFVALDEVEVMPVNTSRFEAVRAAANKVRERSEILGVCSSSEYFAPQAALLASSLRLPAPDEERLRTARNKYLQRLQFRAVGLATPAFECVDSPEAALAVVRKVGLPCVVKPLDGSGSLGVRLCASAEQMTEQVIKLLGRNCNERGLPVSQQVLIEEYLIGPEFSVETFDQVAIGITRKHLGPLPYFVESGHDFPALSEVSEEMASTLKRVALSGIKALGLEWGAGHVELRWTPNGPIIIEVNPRLAGGFIPDLVRRAIGIDLVRQTIAKVTNLPVNVTPRFARRASIRFHMALHSGTLKQADPTCASTMPGFAEFQCYKKLGERIEHQGDFRDRVAHVIAEGTILDNVPMLANALARVPQIVIE